MQQRNPEAVAYRRNAARLTSLEVLCRSEKEELIAKAPPLRRRRARADFESGWASAEAAAAAEASEVLAILTEAAVLLGESLEALVGAQAPELLGAAETEHHHVRTALDCYAEAEAALERRDFG